jgi:hypothetical protein
MVHHTTPVTVTETVRASLAQSLVSARKGHMSMVNEPIYRPMYATAKPL